MIRRIAIVEYTLTLITPVVAIRVFLVIRLLPIGFFLITIVSIISTLAIIIIIISEVTLIIPLIVSTIMTGIIGIPVLFHGSGSNRVFLIDVVTVEEGERGNGECVHVFLCLSFVDFVLLNVDGDGGAGLVAMVTWEEKDLQILRDLNVAPTVYCT